MAAFNAKHLTPLGIQPASAPRVFLYDGSKQGGDNSEANFKDAEFYQPRMLANPTAAQMAEDANILGNDWPNGNVGVAGCILIATTNEGDVATVRIVPKDDGTIAKVANASDDKYNAGAKSRIVFDGVASDLA